MPQISLMSRRRLTQIEIFYEPQMAPISFLHAAD